MIRIILIILAVTYWNLMSANEGKRILIYNSMSISVTGCYDSDSLRLAFGGFEGGVIVCISDSVTNKMLIQSSTNITTETHTFSIDIRELLQESYHIEILINSNQEYEGYLHTIRHDGFCCEKHRNTLIPNQRKLDLYKK